MRFNFTKFSTKEINLCNRFGFIPGPKESEEAFKERIKTLEKLFENPPEGVDHFLTDTDWKGALEKTEELFGFAPDWIVAHYSNKQLPFFQGAATWITERAGVRIPIVQLREGFERGRYLGIYSRDEILAHETVHAVRMCFDEPIFEEFFAYQTSLSRFRKFLGPLFQNSWESYLFIFFLFIPFGLEVTKFFVFDVGYYVLLAYLPALLIGGLLGRLCFLHYVLRRAKRRIKEWGEEKPLATLVRLRDSEVFLFAFGSDEKCEQMEETFKK